MGVLAFSRPSNAPSTATLRAVMLGCGTVGGALAHRLPQAVTLEGVLVRTARAGLSKAPVFTRLDDVLALKPDLVIEALPAGPLAEAALQRALEAGSHVVSANKAALAHRQDLFDIAEARKCRLRCSAAVGGGVPVLETLERLEAEGRGVVRVRGVLNGTSNYVLDRLAAGEDLDRAVKAAQEAGFAEADPGADLDGLDAAAKLCLIARTAWGVTLSPGDIATRSIRSLPAGLAAKAAREGRRIRQVATLARAGNGIHGAVRLELLDLDDPLSRAREEANAVVITPQSGFPLILSGKGAGAVPTAASMRADIDHVLAGCRR